MSDAPNAVFEKALQRHLTAVKPNETVSAFAASSPNEVLIEIENQSATYIKNSRLIRYANRFKNILGPLQLLLSSLDQTVSGQSAIAGAVWGCLRFIVTVAINFASYFERIIEVLENITENLRFYQDYTQLYTASKYVQEALADVYAAILMVCREIKQTFKTSRNEDRSTPSILLRTLNPWNRNLDTLVRDLNKRQRILKQETKHADRIIENEDRRIQSDRDRIMDERESDREWEKARTKFLEEIPYAQCYSKHGKCQEVLSASLDAGRWLLERKEYKKWKDSSHGLLWLNAKPGAGKTILASIVIEDLEKQKQQQPRTAVAYFYCQHDDVAKRDANNLVGTVLHQLVRHISLGTPLLRRLRDDSIIIQTKSIRGLQELVGTVSTEFERIYVVVDALDECDPSSLISVLQSLKRLSESVCLFVTSRDRPEIRHVLANDATISVEPLDIQLDIRQFAEKKIRLLSDTAAFDPDIKLKVRDPALRDEIIKTLTIEADGMFLWVDFQIAHLQQQSSDYEIKQALKSLPRGLEATFMRSLHQIEELSSSRRARVRRVLRWVVCAHHPLSLNELVEAVAIDDMDESTWDETRLVNDPLTLITDCAYLIAHSTYRATKERQFDHVQLIHASVADFLTGSSGCLSGELCNYRFAPPHSVHKSLAQSCLKYLHLTSDREWGFQIRGYEHHPFLNYVSSSFFRHVQLAGAYAEDLFDQFNNLISLPKIKTLMSSHRDAGGWIDEVDGLTILHVVSLLDLSVFAKIILAMGLVDASQRDSTGRTPLHCSALSDGVATMKVLLEVPGVAADINITDNKKRTPLHCASANWKGSDCVKLLLEQGAKVNVCNEEGQTPLLAANLWGETHKTLLLLQHGADITAVDSNGQNILHKAATWGDLDHLSLIKDRTDLNLLLSARDQQGLAPQHIAASNGHTDFLRFLLGQGADIQVCDFEGEGLLHKACTLWHSRNDTLSMLLESGKLDVNQPNNDGVTPLLLAAGQGNSDSVNTLLRHGAKTDVFDDRGDSVVHKSADLPLHLDGSLECLKLFIDLGLDVNSKNRYGYSPLHMASGSLDKLKLLLEAGADLRVLDNSNRSVLHLAAGRWSTIDKTDTVECLEFLIEHGLDIDAMDNLRSTPLLYAAQSGNLNRIKFLMERGADPKHMDNLDHTLLHKVCMKPSTVLDDARAVKFVLQLGIDLHAMTSYGTTAAHLAARAGNIHTLSTLVDHGANLDILDSDGNTILHSAASSGIYGATKCLNFIIQRGALDLDKPNNNGLTILHLAALAGNAESVRHIINMTPSVNLRAVDKQGRTALHCAASDSYWQDNLACKIILEQTSDLINAVDDLGETPLFGAASAGNVGCLELLLSHDADISILNQNGESLLHKVCLPDIELWGQSARRQCAEILLKKGLKATTFDMTGRSALHHATTKEMIHLLLDHGLDVNARDNSGSTPLHSFFRRCGTVPLEARLPEHKLVDSIIILANKDADLNAKDEEGMTPFEVASLCGCQSLVDMYKTRINSPQ